MNERRSEEVDSSITHGRRSGGDTSRDPGAANLFLNHRRGPRGRSTPSTGVVVSTCLSPEGRTPLVVSQTPDGPPESCCPTVPPLRLLSAPPTHSLLPTGRVGTSLLGRPLRAHERSSAKMSDPREGIGRVKKRILLESAGEETVDGTVDSGDPGGRVVGPVPSVVYTTVPRRTSLNLSGGSRE